MIVAIGVDIVEIGRVGEALGRWSDGFLKKVFTQRELSGLNGRCFSAQHIAVRFAGKEAVMKVLGNGSAKVVRWKEIEILGERNGRPRVEVDGRYREIMERDRIEKILISLSHSRDYAIANAIAVGERC